MINNKDEFQANKFDNLDKEDYNLNNFHFLIYDRMFVLNKKIYKLNRTLYDSWGGFGSDEIVNSLVNNKNKLTIYKFDGK